MKPNSLVFSLLLGGCALSCSVTGQAAERPNIVPILADDLASMLVGNLSLL